jgi:hypothetical protein
MQNLLSTNGPSEERKPESPDSLRAIESRYRKIILSLESLEYFLGGLPPTRPAADSETIMSLGNQSISLINEATQTEAPSLAAQPNNPTEALSADEIRALINKIVEGEVNQG